jgi:Leucine-rich repeat (LRR) protein
LGEEYNNSFFENAETEDFQFDFISLLRYRELGTIEEELPSFYFEELEGELNLSGSNLYDLYGLDRCINLNKVDLSNNQILDVNQIGYLEQLVELNLSENNIHSIDSLKNCKKLEYLDISFNDVTDIYMLRNLMQLKYLNVIGNQIPVEQIELFKQNDMVFIY